MDADDAFAERIMAEHGIPEDVRQALIGVSQSYRGWGAAATVTRPLAAGPELRLRDRTLRVHHRLGHSPSDTIFHDEAQAIVLGADHLIKHISSNPLISRPLTAASVQDADGGGGGGETAEREHARRAEKIRGLVAEGGAGGSVTAYEIAQSLWGNVAVTQAYLTLSEVLGHVDLLVTDGQVVEQRDGGVVRFAAAG